MPQIRASTHHSVAITLKPRAIFFVSCVSQTPCCWDNLAQPSETRMIDRRYLLGLLAGSMATPALAATPGMSRMTAYGFSFAGLDGKDIKLADFAGKPLQIGRAHV